MADVILNIKIPDIWTIKVLDAFNAIASNELVIRTAKARPNINSGLVGHWKFTIGEKQPAETNKQFGERVLRELGKAVIDMVDEAEDNIRYKAEIDAITLPNSDVPPDILE